MMFSFIPTHPSQPAANAFLSNQPRNPGAGIAKQIAAIAAAAFAGLASFFFLAPPFNLLAICALGAIGMIGASWQSQKEPWTFRRLPLPGKRTFNPPSHAYHPRSRSGNGASSISFSNAAPTHQKTHQKAFEHKSQPPLGRSFSTHSSGAASQPHPNSERFRRPGGQGAFASGANASGRIS